jgi:asparagine synthase (glutamine-hydrolysing)
MVGTEPGVPPLPRLDAGTTPRQALEESVLAPLRRPPCVVSFSGGRDSSAVLAVATLVARREGLPLPIPASIRYPDPTDEVERRYQEKVITLLGLEDWHVIHAGPELELLGEDATALLLRYGPLHPRHRHLLAPVLRASSGGSVLTGFDGNGTFGHWRFARASDVIAGRARPGPRDIGRVAVALAPAAVRRARLRRSVHFGQMYWLRPAVEELVMNKLIAEEAEQPAAWSSWLAWHVARRGRVAVEATQSQMGVDAGVAVSHPLADNRFIAALALAGGRRGLGDRHGIMRRLFSDLLPDDVLTRSFPPSYTSTLWGDRTRAFAASWNGSGLDPELVDPDRLRDAWRMRDNAATLPLQAAWLATAGGQATEAA